MAKFTIKKVNSSYPDIFQRINEERRKADDKYHVYLEIQERKYLKDVYGFGAFGCFFFVLTIIIVLSASANDNAVIILMLVGILFAFVAPALANVTTFLRSRAVIVVTAKGVEQWQCKKGSVKLKKDVEWPMIKHVWAIKAEHYSIAGKDNFKFFLMFDPSGTGGGKGRIEVQGFWKNTQSLMRDALRNARNADLGISEPFMRGWLKESELS